MPDESSVATIRAAVEAIVPGAAALRVHEHVAHSIESATPGFAELTAILLDAFATDVRPGSTFVDLSLPERGEVLRLMTNGETQDLRDAVDALLVFTYGGVYSEWTGYDRATSTLTPPDVWARSGYHGPVDGVPDYR